MMIEADILMGTKVGGKDNKRIPVMAHPPSTTSDLDFSDFLKAVQEKVFHFQSSAHSEQSAAAAGVKKGIKLDFKDINAVKPVLKALQNAYDESKLSIPVWINADILRGPVDAVNTPLNASQFLNYFKRFNLGPDVTLSVGWTTRYGWDDQKG
jgi:hypothetical protein